MSFPVPDVYTSDAKDIAREERKRLASPPSFFISRVQGLVVAARYFENRATGYSGTAKKHLQRLNSAFLGQMLASFEWCLKDYLAMILSETAAFDDRLRGQDWVRPRVETVLAQRSEGGTLGAILIHPTLGWHDVHEVNRRFKRLFGLELVAKATDQSALDTLWVLRHSLAHNAGIVTHVDAYRIKAVALAEKVAAIDLAFLKESQELLVRIVRRLEQPIGDAVLKQWFETSATGNYLDDKSGFVSLKLIATAVAKRTEDLPRITKGEYTKNRKAAGVAAT